MKPLCAAALFLLAACAADPVGEAPLLVPAAAVELSAAPRYKAVLIAGDRDHPVYDNAVAYAADRLAAAGVPVRRLAASERGIAAGAAPATLGNILDVIGGISPAPGEGCFVFITSHGHPRRGMMLPRSRDYLDPAQLDAALSRGCGTAPTVAVVSGCYTGGFAVPPMARPNRIVITAARADRPSFGCGAGFTYAVFDQCLLAALDGAALWRDAFAATGRCVTAREALFKERPSEPQGFFGPAVTELPTPWRVPAPPVARFEGSGRFVPSEVPMQPRLLDQQRTLLEGYARAAHPKAAALSPDGVFTWSQGSGDVGRRALEGCEWMAAVCSLYALDDVVAARLPSGLLALQPPLLARDGAFAPQAIPFVPSVERERIGREYALLAGPKALAVSLSGRLATAGRGPSGPAAREAALSRCRQKAADCLLVAENDRFILGYPSPPKENALGKN